MKKKVQSGQLTNLNGRAEKFVRRQSEENKRTKRQWGIWKKKKKSVKKL